MLTMEQIYHIRFECNQKGKSLRKIAKDEGVNFRTVKKYVEMEDFNTKRHACSRKGKLEPYKEIIDQWLTDDLKAKPKQRHTAKRVYDRLKEMYGDAFDISDRSVRAYVSKKRKELTCQNEGSLPA